jgi:DNA polymerase III subunit gamma/tau
VSYQVLARKYRPTSFADVVGQDAVVQTIGRALSTGRVAHAFLFTGSRGVGKTTLARILARCLACETGPTSTPCGTCSLCKAIGNGSAVDVVEIDGASNTGVDQIRDLQEMARFLPQSARYKIFIIDEVHMLTTSAFNALLKTLEEPPPHLKFIFATTEPHKIPITVLSRCQRYDFKRISSALIAQRLKAVLDHEQVSIDAAGLDVIARAADGGMRDALSLTDQVLSFAGAVTGGLAVTAAAVIEALSLIDHRTIAALADNIIIGDTKAVLDIVDDAYFRGHDLKQLMTAVAEQMRHITVSQATGSIHGRADLADDDLAHVDARAQATDARDALRLLQMAIEATDAVARAADARIVVEMSVLKMARRVPLADAILISDALVRLDAIARGKPVPPLPANATTTRVPRTVVAAALAPTAHVAAPPAVAVVAAPIVVAAKSVVAAPVEPTPIVREDGEDEPVFAQGEPEPAAAPVTTAAVIEADDTSDDDDLADPARHLPLTGIPPAWIKLVDVLTKTARPLAMHLDQARVLAMTDDSVTVAFERGLHKDAVLQALKGLTLSHKIVVADAVTDDASPSIVDARKRALEDAQAALVVHAKSHPVVQKTLALFGGEIRKVQRA